MNIQCGYFYQILTNESSLIKWDVWDSAYAILLVEFAGADLGSLKAQLSRLEALMGDLKLPGSVVCMTDPSAQRNLWEVRKAGLNIMMSLRGDGKPVSFIEDCAVPLENLAEYTSALTEVFQRHGSRGTWYAHASVGTLHVRPILDMRKDGAKKMREIAEEASTLVKQFKGGIQWRARGWTVSRRVDRMAIWSTHPRGAGRNQTKAGS